MSWDGRDGGVWRWRWRWRWQSAGGRGLSRNGEKLVDHETGWDWRQVRYLLKVPAVGTPRLQRDGSMRRQMADG